jgi:hypothetical protein
MYLGLGVGQSWAACLARRKDKYGIQIRGAARNLAIWFGKSRGRVKMLGATQ